MNRYENHYIAKSPYCEHQLDPASAVNDTVTCACGHKSDARWVAELGWLQARAAWVSERISKSDPWFEGEKVPSVEQEAPKKSVSGQQLLYILGGISMVVAVAVFTAVAWERIGALGQLAALLLVVAVASFVAIKSKDSLVGLSNTSAVLATIVAGTGLLSAPEFGLINKALSHSDSIYTPSVLFVVALASFGAGYLTKIPGWTYVGLILMVPATFVFTENYSSQTLSSDGYHAVSVVTFSIAAFLLAFGKSKASQAHRLTQFFNISIVILQIFLAANLFTHSMDAVGLLEQPFVLALVYLGVAAVWIFAATRTGKSTLTFVEDTAGLIASYVASALIGFALAYVFIPAVQYPLDPYDVIDTGGAADRFLVYGTALGALIMAAPALKRIDNLNLNRFFTLTSAVLWIALFSGLNQQTMSGPVQVNSMIGFFGLIAIGLFVRWSGEVHIGYYIPTLIFGSIAIALVVVDKLAPDFEGPEAVTFSIATYLLAMALLFNRRTGVTHKSFVTLGLPLLVALIPSALVANALLFVDKPDSLMWTRFWTVIAVSVACLILGLKLQKSGLFLPGAIGFAIVSLPQIFLRLSVIVPRWIIFGVIGILLITIAARFEHLQKLGRDTSRWFRSLD